MKARQITARLLMAFVLVTIGFAVGKEMTLRAINSAAPNSPANEHARQTGDQVVVYYMHATFRCFTCNNIESMAKEVVENNFAAEVAQGKLEWQSVNFQENLTLGRRYGVGTSTLVLAKISDGREVAFERLDEVWTKVNNPDAFKQYVEQMINAYLNGDSV